MADGVELSVAVWPGPGRQAPVLLVHGLASNARLWDGVATELSALGHPVAAVDQRGHGLSSKPGTGYDFATLGRDLLAVLAGLGWSDHHPYIAGQSWGANVVVDLAAGHPGRLGGIALIDGGTIDLQARFADWPTCEVALAPPWLSGTAATRMERTLRSFHPDWPDSAIAGTMANLEILPDGTVRPWLPRETHMTILRHLWDHRPGDLYASVREPVLIVAARDPSDPRWMSAKRAEVAAATAGLSDVEVHWMEGDHDLHAQHPGPVAALIHRAAGASVR